MPAKLSPALATPVSTPPQGEDWIHEVKYDGYRMLSRLDKGEALMYSRNGKDWADKFPAIALEVKRLKAASAWLDGEVCAVDAKGRSDFQALQNALSRRGAANLVYFAFDLIHLDGYDLARVSLVERKRLLKALLDRSNTQIRYSPEVRGSGAQVFGQACSMGLEGVVCKRVDSTYHAGARSRDWVKVKCSLRQEMVIGGFTDPQGSRSGFGALLLGVYHAGELQYSGKVGTGFDERTLSMIRGKLDRLARQTPPFRNPPRGFEAKGAHWVAPKLVAEIEFAQWSDAGALRHPSFVGLREDKKAIDVVREKPVAVKATRSSRPRPSASKTAKPAKKKTASALPAPSAGKTAKPAKPDLNESRSDTVARVKISHPDKLLFPEAKLSKLALARYYESVAAWILPHIKDRPLSLFRCPDGWNNQCFYQKHADRSVHASVTRVEVPEGARTATYLSAGSLQALVGLVQWGVIELHPWGSRMPRPERPDRLTFDFDPAEDVSWSQLVKAVDELRTLLKQLGLAGFLKTTGGKGLHVVVPIKPTLTWEQAKAFTKAIADLFARTFPDRFVSTMSKSRRKGRIFIDYLRNAEGATAIAAYGIRARKNAPVSTPISWKELSTDVRFDFFNVRTVPVRLSKLREDPWKDFTAVRQTVTRAMFRQVGMRV